LKSDKLYLAFADPCLGELHLEQIDRPILQTVRAVRFATGVQAATVNRLVEMICALLNRCAKAWEWIDRAPYMWMLNEPKQRFDGLRRIGQKPCMPPYRDLWKRGAALV
jgi:hypothetical protein